MKHWKVGPREPDNVEFGIFLQTKRTRLAMSRATVALRLDISSEYLRLIEKGARTPVEGDIRNFLDTYRVEYKFSEDGRWVLEDEATVEFTSRIRESRIPGHNVLPPRAGVNRQERIGLIVEKLPRADIETLIEIHEILNRSRENHGV